MVGNGKSKASDGSEGRVNVGRPGSENDGREKSKSGKLIAKSKEIDGSEGSVMVGRSGNVKLGNAKSKSGNGMAKSNASDGNDGNEMSGRPGRLRSGKLHTSYSMQTLTDALPATPVTPVSALLTPGTATEPMHTLAPSSCAAPLPTSLQSPDARSVRPESRALR